MILTESRFCVVQTKKICRKKIQSKLVMDLIFGHISTIPATKLSMKNKKRTSIQCTTKRSRKSNLKSSMLISSIRMTAMTKKSCNHIKLLQVKKKSIRLLLFMYFFVCFQDFGHANTPIESVKEFYRWWTSFSSYKQFTWVDTYNTTEAPNRWVKRQMEKENKKERLNEKKTYVKTIKELVECCKRRDPRWKEVQEALRE